jgi:hypothetical protein
MKNADRNDQGRSSQQSYPKEDVRNRGAEKQPGKINIPGGAGAAGQIPIKGNDAKQQDDPFRRDVEVGD